MRELPLSVVLSAVISDDKILLIRRNKGDYSGFLALPGGKVEINEHVSQAAVREIVEEAGIECDFVKHLGVVSEILLEEETSKSFLLHICELKPKSTVILNDCEGKLEWFKLADLSMIKHDIVPSDFLMIEKIILKHEKSYYDCVLEKKGNGYALKKFE